MKGATIDALQEDMGSDISIHAPVKGATKADIKKYGPEYISIHAPVKGATSMWWTMASRETNFNPRSREGSDDYGGGGASLIADFNPRSREGSDAYGVDDPRRV